MANSSVNCSLYSKVCEVESFRLWRKRLKRL